MVHEPYLHDPTCMFIFYGIKVGKIYLFFQVVSHHVFVVPGHSSTSISNLDMLEAARASGHNGSKLLMFYM